MSFSGDVLAFERKVKKRAGIIFKKVSFDTYGDIIRMTPVDTGRAKGNWLIQIDNVPLGISDESDKSGSKGLAEAASVTNRLKLGSSLFIMNNLPYMQKLEDGSSNQAPNGMVKLSALRFKRRVKEIARSFK